MTKKVTFPKKWGGKRTNSGRKPIEVKKKIKRVGIQVSPEIAEQLKMLKNKQNFKNWNKFFLYLIEQNSQLEKNV